MRKRYEISLLVTLAIITLGAITSYISVRIYGRNDAPPEQLAEDIIKSVTGISIDFTSEN